MEGDHAWFRAGTEQPWHEVARRDDLDLIARCGYTRTWPRSQQARAVTPLGTACPRCAALHAAGPSTLTASARG